MNQPFTIQGPDNEGNVWLTPNGNTWTVQQREDGTLNIKLGPKDQVAEILSQWLGQIDYLERE